MNDQGKRDEALACFRRAIELKPDYTTAYNNLGAVLSDQGKQEEALACFHRALEAETGLRRGPLQPRQRPEDPGKAR